MGRDRGRTDRRGNLSRLAAVDAGCNEPAHWLAETIAEIVREILDSKWPRVDSFRRGDKYKLIIYLA
jgi:hypothetical protein